MESLLAHVEGLWERKCGENLAACGAAYVPYTVGPEQWVLSDVDVYRDKVLRIPSSCFMTVERCHSHQGPEGRVYELSTYTPCPLPFADKCGAYLDTSDDSAQHRHDYYELIYVHSGWRTMLVEGEELVLGAGEALLFDTRCAHLDVRTRSEGVALYVEFTGRLANGYLQARLSSERVRSLFQTGEEAWSDARYVMMGTVRQPEAVGRCLAAMFEELEAEEAGYDRMVQVMLLRLFNAFDDSGSYDVSVGERLNGAKLHMAIARYIDEHIATVTIGDLCREFHYQEDYYNRLMRRVLGLTYSDYVSSRRLELAKGLLINTDLSVKDVMERVGYRSHPYFYRIFRQDTGMTPKAYRESFRKSE